MCGVCKSRRGENCGANAPFFGKSHSIKAIEKIKTARGLQDSSFKGKNHTKETKNKIRRKLLIPICQYSLTGEFIRDWDGVVLAARKLNLHSSNIVACLKNKAKTTGGYMWKYRK